MKVFGTLFLMISAALALVVSGGMIHKSIETTRRAELNARLEQCGYIRHPIADVAWELVRRGEIPVCSASAMSYMFISRNDSNILTPCMEKHYPEPACNGPR